MPQIGYHASHEQHPPSRLLHYVKQAEQAGFQAVMSSDHFHPWTQRQGESGFAWSWLGAAMQAVSLPMGTVSAPGQRYHPAIIARAAATLSEMFPGRFWLAVGTGEQLNEHITGDRWPSKAERNDRLRESADIIRALWRGETVSRRGHVTVDDATLYTRPETPPLLVGAALTPKTARWMGEWADALVTVAHPLDELTRVVNAFRNNGGDGKPVYLQVQLSYAQTDEEALRAAHEEWSSNIFESSVLADLRSPADFEAAAQFVRPDDMHDSLIISSDINEHADRISELAQVGFDAIFLHDVHRDQESFINDFSQIMPDLARL